MANEPATANVMADPALRSLVVGVIKNAEGAAGKEYQASFAQKGGSGLTFGAAQNDVAQNKNALSTFKGVLNEAICAF